jgi:hypothetical protein
MLETVKKLQKMGYKMEPMGFEPTTSCMPCKRSPN